MEVFLASIATEEYQSMASALTEMGATNTDVDVTAFARDLEKIFSSIKASITNLHKIEVWLLCFLVVKTSYSNCCAGFGYRDSHRNSKGTNYRCNSCLC